MAQAQAESIGQGAIEQGVGEQQRVIEQWLAALIGEILEVPPQQVELTTRFDRYGLDSVAVVGVIDALSQHLGRELDATVMYDFPTIRKLAQHLAAQ